jgi:hypothetical protein
LPSCPSVHAWLVRITTITIAITIISTIGYIKLLRQFFTVSAPVSYNRVRFIISLISNGLIFVLLVIDLIKKKIARKMKKIIVAIGFISLTFFSSCFVETHSHHHRHGAGVYVH